MKPQLAVIRGCVVTVEYNGTLVEIVESVPSGCFWQSPDGVTWQANAVDCYAVESLGRDFSAKPQKATSRWMLFEKRCVFPINDNPGNEAFVTELRNKIKGKTEISERGELQS